MLLSILIGFIGTPVVSADDPPEVAQKDSNKTVPWKAMTKKWEECQFGGDGPVSISDDLITLGVGDPITGVRWTGDFPKNNYEIRLEARRVEGFDFFSAITLPVGDQHCSVILGGWGGSVTGSKPRNSSRPTPED